MRETKRRHKILNQKIRNMMVAIWQKLIEVMKSKNYSTLWRITTGHQNTDLSWLFCGITVSCIFLKYTVSFEPVPSYFRPFPCFLASRIRGKTPENGSVLAMLIKDNTDWWSVMKVSLLTFIDNLLIYQMTETGHCAHCLQKR